jgi:branched-chain amino acid transport system permease protein
MPFQRTGSIRSVIEFLLPSLATMAIFAVICIGLNVQWGYTGIFNFGVVGFFLVGAYTAAIVTMGPADGEFTTYIGGFGEALAAVPLPGAANWVPFVVGTVAAAGVSALLALLLAWPMVRLREDYLAIALIGMAEVLRRIVTEEQWLVNGSRGLGGIPRPLAGVVDGDTYKYLFLLLAVGLLALVYLLADLGIRSPWGRVLRAIREDEAAAAAAGKNVNAFKLQGFVLGAAIMGMGGAFYAFQQGAISPDAFTHFFGTFIFWAMLIAGGSGNMAGPLSAPTSSGVFGPSPCSCKGTIFHVLADRVPHLRDTLVGLTIVLVLLINPRGLLPEQARVSRWLDRRVRVMRRGERQGAGHRRRRRISHLPS